MSWIKEKLGLVETPQEEETVVTEEPVAVEAEPEVTEEPLADVETPEQVEEVVQPEPTTDITEEPVAAKQTVEYKEWLDKNKDSLYTYLKEQGTDYNSLDPEELVRLKLAKDNPQWTPEEVKDELSDRYGIGLKKVEINEDEMTDDEIQSAKKHNQEVDRAIAKGQRLLKTDAKSAAEEFEKRKSSLELPEFEFELPTTEIKKEEDVFDVEKFNEELIKQAQEQREKEWLPVLQETFKEFDSVQKTVKYNDNGSEVAIDVNYKLSEKEKEQIINYLGSYNGHPEDSKFSKEDGSVDMKRFAGQKSAELILDSLLSTVAKEASARARAELVKKDLVNYDDTPRGTVATEELSHTKKLQSTMWDKSKRR